MKTQEAVEFLSGGGQVTLSEWNDLTDEDKKTLAVVGMSLETLRSQKAASAIVGTLADTLEEAGVEMSLDNLSEKLKREYSPTMPTG